MQRLLVHFARRGDLKYLSHLEMSRAVTRALARARMPLAFSQGFNPHPRLSFWHALPVGVQATEELAEVWLQERVEPAEALARLAEAVPHNLEILEVEEVGEDEPRLTKRFTHAIYLIRMETCGEDADDAGEALVKGIVGEDGEVLNVVVGAGGTEVSLLASHREDGPRLRRLAREAAECLGIEGASAIIVRKGLYRSREEALAARKALEDVKGTRE